MTSNTERSEVRKVWDGIEAWYKNNVPDLYRRLPEGASDAQIATLANATGLTLPAAYKESLKIHNGGIYFGEYHYMNVEGAAHKWQGLTELLEDGTFRDRKVADAGSGIIKDAWWHRSRLPFAEESGGNLLCLDMAPGPGGHAGQVIYMELASGPFPGEHRSFLSLLQQYLTDLQTGKYALDEDGFLSEAST